MSVTSPSHALKKSLYTSFVSLSRGLLSAPVFLPRLRSLIFPRRHGETEGFALSAFSPGFTRKALLALFCDCDLVSPAAPLARRDWPSTFLVSIPRLWCISRAI